MRRRLLLSILPIIAILLSSGCDGNFADNGNNSYSGGNTYQTSPPEYWSPGTEKHPSVPTSGWVAAGSDSLSTFGADVDEGSYTFARSKILQGYLPDSASIRPEEFINYFDPRYEAPTDDVFGIHAEVAPSLWRGDSLHVMRVGIQARRDTEAESKPWNLTFLVDVSGSMAPRMAFVKEILNMVVDGMRPGDILSIAAYDYEPRTILEPTTLADRDKAGIKALIAALEADGSTNMAAGMVRGYELNDKMRLAGGNNRVVVVSDGDANVGETDADGILTLIRQHTEAGTTISTLGVGEGNYNADMMESLADRGDGNYHYLDSRLEAERVLKSKLMGTMVLVARDLKIQVAFRPERVERYRLIGYENRAIADGDFEQDTTDAGEIGSGHHVTALYELRLKPGGSGDIATVRLRYHTPAGAEEVFRSRSVGAFELVSTAQAASRRFQFLQGVAEFAERLRRSPWAGAPWTDLRAVVDSTADATVPEEAEILGLLRRMN
jgi:Ca-activated chloride channel family protein